MFILHVLLFLINIALYECMYAYVLQETFCEPFGISAQDFRYSLLIKSSLTSI